MSRVVIPFSSGVREDVDPKVMPQGALKRVENLRMRSDGRLEPRFGYTTLATTVQGGGVLIPRDLVAFNGRLLALASTSNGPPKDIYEYVNQDGFAWRPTDADHEQRLCPVTSVRDVGRPPMQSESVTVSDVGAYGGLVCLTWQTSAGVLVHIFDPATDSTIEMAQIEDRQYGRVCVANGIFFVVCMVTADNSVELYRFDPATDDNLTQIADAFAAGDDITALDATASQDGLTFIVGVGRDTPTTTIGLFSGAGALTQTIVGPAVEAFTLTVFRQSARAHLVVCEASDRHIDLYTYTVPAGALENTSLDLDSSFVCNMQVGICLDFGGTNLFLAYGTVDLTAPFDNEVRFLRINPSTHVVAAGVAEWHWVILNSKPLATDSATIFAAVLLDASQPATISNLIGFAETQQIGCVTEPSVALGAFQTYRAHISYDSTTDKYYSVKYVQDKNGSAVPVVAELVIESSERRQTAVIDNQLYLAGGAPQSFAARQVVEAGFLSRPLIVSTTPGSVGSITPSTTYQVCAIYEWTDEQGRLHSSEPSEVIEVEMGPTDDSILVEVTKPLSLRCNATNQVFGGSVSVVIFRSLASPDKQLLRDEASYVSAAALSAFGDIIQINLTRADESATPGAGLNEQEVLYTQGSSGARSGPNPFVSPLPCRYIWASADKLLTGGLPSDSQVQESRPVFPVEPVTWTRNLGGIASATERVLAVARLDDRRFAWTASAIFEFTGDGLDINGSGDVGLPRRLPSPGGLYGGDLGWRSLVETSVGIFFQMASDAIYLLPRGGGAPTHIGHPVADTLRSYPIIAATCYVRSEQLVYFLCNASPESEGSLARTLVYDLEYQQWFVDTEVQVGAFHGACEFGGRLVRLKSTAVQLEDSAQPPSVFVETLVETGSLYPFGQGGQGQIDEIQLYGEFRGNCVITASLSFDDGVSYTALTQKTLTTPTYAVGQTVTLKWGPQRIRGDRVRLKFAATAVDGAATAGFVYNYATVDFTPAGRSALRDTTQKG